MEKKWTSRKFWLVSAIVIFSAVAVAAGQATWDQATGFVLMILGPYLGLNIAEKTRTNGG